MELTALRAAFTDSVAASLYVLFTGLRTATSVQSIGSLLLPRVRLHLLVAMSHRDDRARHVFTNVAAMADAMGCAFTPSSESIVHCVLGMLLELDVSLLYSCTLQPAYLRAAVYEALYILCSSIASCESLPAGSALHQLLSRVHVPCQPQQPPIDDSGSVASLLAPIDSASSAPSMPTELGSTSASTEQMEALKLAIRITDKPALPVALRPSSFPPLPLGLGQPQQPPIDDSGSFASLLASAVGGDLSSPLPTLPTSSFVPSLVMCDSSGCAPGGSLQGSTDPTLPAQRGGAISNSGLQQQQQRPLDDVAAANPSHHPHVALAATSDRPTSACVMYVGWSFSMAAPCCVLLRLARSHLWCTPGGMALPGEDIVITALREMYEELCSLDEGSACRRAASLRLLLDDSNWFGPFGSPAPHSAFILTSLLGDIDALVEAFTRNDEVTEAMAMPIHDLNGNDASFALRGANFPPGGPQMLHLRNKLGYKRHKFAVEVVAALVSARPTQHRHVASAVTAVPATSSSMLVAALAHEAEVLREPDRVHRPGVAEPSTLDRCVAQGSPSPSSSSPLACSHSHSAPPLVAPRQDSLSPAAASPLAHGPTVVDPSIPSWIADADLQRVVRYISRSLRPSRLSGPQGALLVSAIESSVRSAVRSASATPPSDADDCAARLLECRRFLDTGPRSTKALDNAVAAFRQALSAHAVLHPCHLLPPPPPSTAFTALAFFVRGGSGDEQAVARGPTGCHSTHMDYVAADLSSRLTDAADWHDLVGTKLTVNAQSFMVLTEEAKALWLDDLSDLHASTSLDTAMAGLERVSPRPPSSSAAFAVGVPPGYRHSNLAIANAARARRTTPVIVWKGVPYPLRTLGVWRRVLCLWRGRITGWFTSAEIILYYSCITKIEKGAPDALESLRSLVQRTRYVNGRLPGCSRYTAYTVTNRYKWNGRKGHCIPMRSSQQYGYPFDRYGFTVSRHTHGSILRLGSIPMWCYFRHKSEARCLFGLRDSLTQAHRLAQQARIEERALHFCLYREGYALKYGPPVQVNKGCLPGAFTKGVSQAGFEVAGIDISPKSEDFVREFRPSNSATRVTFTLGDALDEAVVTLALSKHPGLRHTSTFSAFNCQPHTSVNHMRPGQGLDSTGRILNSALAIDRRAYVRRGVPWFNESVVGSTSSVSDQYSHVIVTGFLTGEASVDIHVIYHEDNCPPLIDDELLEHSKWMAAHACGGMLRPFQHLGPDNVPVYMGERDPSDPSRWVHYVKPGGGWVNRRPWVCCKGSAMVVFGNMPPGVTHRHWCEATGNSANHIRDTQQLRNALWPRLGLFLGPQLHMYWMAQTYGVPVVDFPESRRDPLLLAWLRSILFCRGPWPVMPFRHYILILAPVSYEGSIVVTCCGHLPDVYVPSRTSTLVCDLASAVSVAYDQISLDKKDLRFAGMLRIFSPSYLVFSSEIIDDDARSKIPSVTPSEFSYGSPNTLVAVPVSMYLAFLNDMALLGRSAWGLDLVTLRAHLRSDMPTAQSLQPYLSADAGVAAHVCLEHGRYLSYGKDGYLPLVYVHESRSVAVADRLLSRSASQHVHVDSQLVTRSVVAADGSVDVVVSLAIRLHVLPVRAAAFASTPLAQRRPAFSAHGIRLTREQQLISQLPFDEQLEHLCPPPPTASSWSPSRRVVNDSGCEVSLPCQARVLTRALAQEIMPHLVPPSPAPRIAPPRNHGYRTRFIAWSERYRATAARLGLEIDLQGLEDLGDGTLDVPDPHQASDPDRPFVPRPPIVHGVCLLPVHHGRVLVVARAGHLVLLADRRSRVSRDAFLASQALHMAPLRAACGRVWVRSSVPPTLPVPYAKLKSHYLRSQGRQECGLPGILIRNHALQRTLAHCLEKEHCLPYVVLSHAQQKRFHLDVGPSHYIRVRPPQTSSASKSDQKDIVFRADVKLSDVRRFHFTAWEVESVEGSLRRAAHCVSPRRGVYDFPASSPFLNALPFVLTWMQSDVNSSSSPYHVILHAALSLGLVSLHAHACSMDCVYGARPFDTPGMRSLERRIHAYLASAPLDRYHAHVTVPVRVDGASPGVGYDVRHQVYVAPIPHDVSDAVLSTPLNAYGSVQRSFLEDGRLYTCPAPLLERHLHSTGRRHMALLVRSAVLVADAPLALTAVAFGAGGLGIQCVLEPLVGSWLSLGDHLSSVLMSSCSHLARRICQAVWSTHVDYSRAPLIDLACDWRVMAALHSRSKRVETRFSRGALARAVPGAICRMWCPRPSVTSPASTFPCYGYVSALVFDRTFQRLYDRFGSSILPGMPQDYLPGVPPHPSSTSDRWHPSDVERVYMSIYRAHHPTVESWRATQAQGRRNPRNVVGLVLSPLPAGFIAPVGLPLNPRLQTLSAPSRWASDDRVTHAAVIVQCYARRSILRGHIRRVRAFRCLCHRLALLNGRDLRVPESLYTLYGHHASWARHSCPRWLGHVASLILQSRWRSWCSPLAAPPPQRTAHVAVRAAIRLQRCARAWLLHGLLQRRRASVVCLQKVARGSAARCIALAARLARRAVCRALLRHAGDRASRVLRRFTPPFYRRQLPAPRPRHLWSTLRTAWLMVRCFCDVRRRRVVAHGAAIAVICGSVTRLRSRQRASRLRRSWGTLRSLWLLARCLLSSRRRMSTKLTRTGRSYSTHALIEHQTPSSGLRDEVKDPLREWLQAQSDDIRLSAVTHIQRAFRRPVCTTVSRPANRIVHLPCDGALVHVGTPHFTIDELVAQASRLLAPRSLRVAVGDTRDGSCLLHAVAASKLSLAEVSVLRHAIASWLEERICASDAFASDFSNSLIANVTVLPSVSCLLDLAATVSMGPQDMSVLRAFCDAYRAYITQYDTYCSFFELLALCHVRHLNVRVMRLAAPSADTLDATRLVDWLSCTCATASSTVSVLYTNEHYDAVLPIRRIVPVFRVLCTLLRLLHASRRSSRSVVPLLSGTPARSVPSASFFVRGGSGDEQAVSRVQRMHPPESQRVSATNLASVPEDPSMFGREDPAAMARALRASQRDEQSRVEQSRTKSRRELRKDILAAMLRSASTAADDKVASMRREALALTQHREQAARLIQLHFCRFAARGLLRRPVPETRPPSPPSVDGTRVAFTAVGKGFTGSDDSVVLEELFCDACGKGGVMNDQGICSSCAQASSSGPSSAPPLPTAVALLLYKVEPSCS